MAWPLYPLPMLHHPQAQLSIAADTETIQVGSLAAKPTCEPGPDSLQHTGTKHGERNFLQRKTPNIIPDTSNPSIPSNPRVVETIKAPVRLQTHELFRRQVYVAVDPFSSSIAQQFSGGTSTVESIALPISHYLSAPTPPPPTSAYVIAFLFDVVPRQIYLHMLLRLPSLYFSRLARLFEEAELSMPDLREMVIVTANSNANWLRDPLMNSVIVPPNYTRLKAEWEYFIDSLVKEWKILNFVSVMLLTVILATLQIDNAYNDPISRNAAFHSLVCAMMSLLYGCVYIIRFNNMRKAHKAAEWAEEAQKTRTAIFWNVWVLLAMPSVWLSWSFIFYFACLFVFIWRNPNDGNMRYQFTPSATLCLRISITAVFGLGVLYFALIVVTLRRYGTVMDRNWQKKAMEWVQMSESREFEVVENTNPSLQSTNEA